MSDEDSPRSSGSHLNAAPAQASPAGFQGPQRGIPLPPPFCNDGRESFQLWARRYEVIQDARYRDSAVDLAAVLASELPTRLPPELFIVWDNLPLETQRSYAETKKCLQAAFGQKDVIASFQTFPNARHRQPNEAMEVYAADICRLVKEAFPDFEPNACEYMKMSRFLAGLDQELQIKCHERGVKTFKEAFEVATQAERARQAARLVMPMSPPIVTARDVSMAQSVNSVSDNDTYLRNAVQDLTATVRDLSKDVGALKLKLDGQSGMHRHEGHVPRRSHRSPSPYGSSPGRYTDNWGSRSPMRHSRNSSPEPSCWHSSSRNQSYNQRDDKYQQPYRANQSSRHVEKTRNPDPYGYPGYYEDRRGPRRSPARHSYDSHHRSPSPHHKHVSFQDYQDDGHGYHHAEQDRRHRFNNDYRGPDTPHQGNGR